MLKSQNFWSTHEVSTLVRAGLWLAVLGGALWFLTRIQMTLTIFGLAWLIAYLTLPVVKLFEGKRLGPVRRCPRGLAVGVIYLCVFAALFVVGSLVFPSISAQFNRLLALQHTLYHPEELALTIQRQGEALISRVPEQYRQTLLERLQSSLGSVSSLVGQGLTATLGYLVSFVGQVAAGTAIFLSATLISIYLLFSWESLYQTCIYACPERYRSDFKALLVRMNQIFGGYLRATILTSASTGVSLLACLTLYSLVSGHPCPYAYIISLVAGVTFPIPLFGVLSTVVAGLILGFIPESSVATGVSVAVVALLVNQIFDRTLLPKLMGDAIGVSPTFVIFAAAAGGEFIGGVGGMLLGIPLAALTKAFFIWFHDLFLVDRRQRGDSMEEAPS